MTEVPVRRRRISWAFVALVVSLVINAFFIGAIATDALRLTYAPKRPVSFELRWLEDRLSAEDFARVSAAVEANRPTAERHFVELRLLRNELGRLLAAPVPDPGAIDAQLDHIREEQGRLIGGLQATIVAAVLALSPAARASLARPLADSRH